MIWKSLGMERYLFQHVRYIVTMAANRPIKYTLAAAHDLNKLIPKTGDPPIIFTACDKGYFEKYAPSFVASISQQASFADVHFHLYNFDACDDILGFSRAHKNVTITVTREEVDFTALEQQDRSAPKQSWRSLYICCSRFLAAREVMKASGRPILLLDVDVLFSRPIQSFFGTLLNSDAALVLRSGEPYMNRRTLGGIVYCSSGELGTQFMDTVCDIIGRFFSRRRYWKAFDQLALYKALTRMRARPGFRLLELGPNEISFDMNPYSVIWYPKGRRKDSDDFVQAQQRLLDKAGTSPEGHLS